MHSPLAIRATRGDTRPSSFRIRWDPAPRPLTQAAPNSRSVPGDAPAPRPLIYTLGGVITHATEIDRLLVGAPGHAPGQTPALDGAGPLAGGAFRPTGEDLPARFSGTLVIDPGVPETDEPARYAYLSLVSRIRRPEGIATIAAHSPNLIRRLTIEAGGTVVLVEPEASGHLDRSRDRADDHGPAGTQLGFSIVTGAGQFRIVTPGPAGPLVEGVITDAIASPAPGWS